jgi:hypothetical protein
LKRHRLWQPELNQELNVGEKNAYDFRIMVLVDYTEGYVNIDALN